MSKYVILVMIIAISLASCPSSESDNPATAKVPAASKANSKPVVATTAAEGQLQRGYDIFHTDAYSNTSLACAHCHADGERTGSERLYIASSGHGSASRGAWKITSQEMLDANEGHAKTLIEAANFCVKAPYMNHAEQLIEGSDAEALTAYLESVATEGEPFVIAKAKKMPVGGLLHDEVNGQRIYSIGCKNCHDTGLLEIPELSGASEWINALQVMAKVRKIGDNYYNDWADMDYLDFEAGQEIPLPGQANPCGENPCGEDQEGHSHDEGHGMFAEGSMPFYSTTILSDQDVVDVAYYVSSKL